MPPFVELSILQFLPTMQSHHLGRFTPTPKCTPVDLVATISTIVICFCFAQSAKLGEALGRHPKTQTHLIQDNPTNVVNVLTRVFEQNWVLNLKILSDSDISLCLSWRASFLCCSNDIHPGRLSRRNSKYHKPVILISVTLLLISSGISVKWGLLLSYLVEDTEQVHNSNVQSQMSEQAIGLAGHRSPRLIFVSFCAFDRLLQVFEKQASEIEPCSRFRKDDFTPTWRFVRPVQFSFLNGENKNTSKSLVSSEMKQLNQPKCRRNQRYQILDSEFEFGRFQVCSSCVQSKATQVYSCSDQCLHRTGIRTVFLNPDLKAKLIFHPESINFAADPQRKHLEMTQVSFQPITTHEHFCSENVKPVPWGDLSIRLAMAGWRRKHVFVMIVVVL